MHEMGTLDELDLALIHAVQLAPRSPWAHIARAIGTAPATASRRWARLRSDGSVWMSVYPAPSRLVLSFVEVDCTPGHVLEAARTLMRDPRIISIEHVSGDRDLLLTVYTLDLPGLSDLLLHELARIPGIRSTRTHIASQTYQEGSGWRLRALDPQQRERLASSARPVRSPPVQDATVHELLSHLSDEPRMTTSELAARLGVSRITARRRADAALSQGALVMRCDLAQALTGWPISVYLWCKVPPAELRTVALTLAGLPETRVSIGVSGGAANLLLALWLRTLNDLQRLEERMAERLPAVQVLDRALNLRPIKRLGHLLDTDGRSIGHVATDPWPPAHTP